MHTGCWHSRSAGCSSHVDAAMREACSGSKSYTLAFETLGVKMVRCSLIGLCSAEASRGRGAWAAGQCGSPDPSPAAWLHHTAAGRNADCSARPRLCRHASTACLSAGLDAETHCSLHLLLCKHIFSWLPHKRLACSTCSQQHSIPSWPERSVFLLCLPQSVRQVHCSLAQGSASNPMAMQIPTRLGCLLR